MRLWHKDLIPYLPRLQLIAQWRECCCICKNIADNGTPNHILVNKIMDYPIHDFYYYSNLVVSEMLNRGYKVSNKSYKNFHNNYIQIKGINENNNKSRLEGWHNERYLRECLFNLEEKAMCNGIPKNEWKIIYDKFGKEFDLWEGEN